MNIKQIGYFISIYDHGSFSAAAKDKFVTVQAVSKAVADLERQFNEQLFVRGSHGAYPTEFGKEFYRRAQPVLQNFNELEQYALSFHDSKSRECSLKLGLCSPPFHNVDRALSSIALFSEANLGIPATVTSLETGKIALDALRSGYVNALITIGACTQPDITCIPLGTVTPGLVMVTNHPLATKESITLEDLKQYPVCAPEEFDFFYETIAKPYRERGLELVPSPVGTIKFEHFLKNNGISFAAGITALGELFPGTITRLIAQDDAVPVPICLASLKNHETSAYHMFEQRLTKEFISSGMEVLKAFARE